MSRRRVVVTGLGALTPNGNDLYSCWDALVNGRAGIGPITKFDASGHRARIAGEIKDFDPESALDRKDVRRNDPFTHYAMYVGLQAVAHAGLDVEAGDAERVGVIWGSGIGGITTHEKQSCYI